MNVSSMYGKYACIKSKADRDVLKEIDNIEKIEHYTNEFLEKQWADKNFFRSKWPCPFYSLSKLLLNKYSEILG